MEPGVAEAAITETPDAEEGIDTDGLPDPFSACMFSRVLVADDSKFTRKIVEELLLEKGIAAEVATYENGLGLTGEYARFIGEEKAVEATVIDINMPEMDGITAARVIRGIEAGAKVSKTLIVFFSAIKADEGLRKQMQQLAPAYYVNKGNDPDPDQLARRLEMLFGELSRQGAGKQDG